MKKVLLISNTLRNLANFRRELIEQLIEEQYTVILAAPFKGCNLQEKEELEEKGCILCDTPIDQLGTKLNKDFLLLRCYLTILKTWKPDIVVTYTIKPNIYGGIACQLKKLPYLTNITGLGRAIEEKNIIQLIAMILYKIGLFKSNLVFFQNSVSRDYMLKHHVVKENIKIVAGSGVNLQRFAYLPYPEKETIDFLLIARIMKEKGIEEYLSTAKAMKQKYKLVNFHICGSCEVEYTGMVEEYHREGWVQYHGEVKDMNTYYLMTDCIVLPSYAEGMSNALLEGAACGRTIIASNIQGCKETFDEGVSGYAVTSQNSKDLADKVEKFIQLPLKQKIEMGKNGRKKMENEFDRRKVNNIYMYEIKKIIEMN